MQLAVIVLALLVSAALIGYLVRRMLLLDQALQEAKAKDDILGRVADTARGGVLPSFNHRRRVLKVREQLPDALDMIANSLTAGLTLPQALLRNLDHLSPEVQVEMARVIYDTRLGFSISQAFENFARRMGIRDAKLIATASQIGVEHGGNIADSYRMLSGLLRENLSFEMELKAMTTEGRMQAIVMSCLPFALIVILLVVNPDMMMPLVTTAIGWMVLAGLCVMLGIAYLWIRKIVDIEV